MEPSQQTGQKVTLIEPGEQSQWLDFSEMIKFKDLLVLLVMRDIKVLYKQTVLGFMWAILIPFIQMVIFTVIFGNLAKIDTGETKYWIFSYAGLVPWTYISQAYTTSSNSLISNRGILGKIYFPRVFIPLTPVLAKLVDLAIAFGFLILMLLIAGEFSLIGLNLLKVFIVLPMMIFLSASIGMTTAALAVQYRDFRFASGMLIQLLMYLAPVVWPISKLNSVTDSSTLNNIIYHIYAFFPVAGILEGFRAAVTNNQMPWHLIACGYISTTVILLLSLKYFKKFESSFADVA